MWIANFVFCTMIDGCVAVTFDDQTDFVKESECEAYTEQKADLVKNTMEERGIVGAIYYVCEFKSDGLKT
jgi:hypothetical protein